MALDSSTNGASDFGATSSGEINLPGDEPQESVAPPSNTAGWEWVSRYAKLEDRISSMFDPVARRLLGLAAFMGLWTYWMPGFAKLQEYVGHLVIVPILLYYGIGVGGLSWGLWHLFRERFPWDD